MLAGQSCRSPFEPAKKPAKQDPDSHDFGVTQLIQGLVPNLYKVVNVLILDRQLRLPASSSALT